MIDSGAIEPEGTFSFTAKQDGVRLDSFISEQFPHYSRNFFKTLIENERVLVNKTPAHKAGIKLKVNDQVTVTFPPARIPKKYNQK